MIRSIWAELIKARGSFAVWLSIFGTIANILIFFSLHLLQPEKWPLKAGWKDYIIHFYEGVAFMMLSLYVVILAALITFMEHRQKMWTYLFALPASRWQVFSGKLVYILIHFILAHFLFITGILISGFVLGLINPGQRLSEQLPDFLLIFTLAYKTILSVLGLLAFQYWISLRFKHFIVPLTIGILGFVTASLLGGESTFMPYNLFGYPIYYVSVMEGSISIQQVGPFNIAELVSIGYFLFFTLLGYSDFYLKRG